MHGDGKYIFRDTLETLKSTRSGETCSPRTGMLFARPLHVAIPRFAQAPRPLHACGGKWGIRAAPSRPNFPPTNRVSCRYTGKRHAIIDESSLRRRRQTGG